MLTMNPQPHKVAIADEAFRVLRRGGRFAIHELALVPDAVASEVKSEIEATLSQSIRVGARPLTEGEWRALLENAGFINLVVRLAPMHLLRPPGFLQTRTWRTLKFVRNVLQDADARRRGWPCARSLRSTPTICEGFPLWEQRAADRWIDHGRQGSWRTAGPRCSMPKACPQDCGTSKYEDGSVGTGACSEGALRFRRLDPYQELELDDRHA